MARRQINKTRSKMLKEKITNPVRCTLQTYSTSQSLEPKLCSELHTSIHFTPVELWVAEIVHFLHQDEVTLAVRETHHRLWRHMAEMLKCYDMIINILWTDYLVSNFLCALACVYRVYYAGTYKKNLSLATVLNVFLALTAVSQRLPSHARRGMIDKLPPRDIISDQ